MPQVMDTGMDRRTPIMGGITIGTTIPEITAGTAGTCGSPAGGAGKAYLPQ